MFKLLKQATLDAVDFTTRAYGASGPVDTRFIVEKGGDLYISDVAATGGGAHSVDETALAALDWYDYDPVSDILGIGGTWGNGLKAFLWIPDITRLGVLRHKHAVTLAVEGSPPGHGVGSVTILTGIRSQAMCGLG